MMIHHARRQRHVLWAVTAAASLLIITLVPLLLVGLREQARESARLQYENLARVFEEHVSRIVSLTDQSMTAMRAKYEADPLGFSLHDWLKNNAVPADVLPQIGIINRSGILTHTTGQNTAKIDLSDRTHFTVQRDAGGADNLYISIPVLGRASGAWTIQLTRPLRQDDGSFDGIVVFFLDIRYFSKFYDSIDIGRSGKVMLVGTNDGTVRAAASDDSSGPNMGESIEGSDLLRAVRSARLGSLATTLANASSRSLFAFRSMSQYPLTVVVGATESDYLRPYNDKSRVILLIGFVSLSLLLGMSYWLDNHLVQQQLTQTAIMEKQLATADAAAEARVREEEALRYHAVTEAAADAIVSWDPKGRMIFCNPSARKLFGLLSEQKVDDVLSTFFDPVEGTRVAQQVDALLRGDSIGTPDMLEVRARRRDGSTFDGELSLSLWRRGDEWAINMVARDVSRRRQAEEERKALLTQAMTAQKMEAIGTLAGGIAHDFNNILGAIQGFLWLAKRGLPANSEAQDFIERASAAGERATQVAKQLLDFSRPNETHMDTFDLRDAVQEVAELTAVSMPATIHRTFLPTNTPLPVRGDATQINQLLLNLVINARQAVGDDRQGSIRVEAKRTTIVHGLFGGSVATSTDSLPMVKSEWTAGGDGGRVWFGNLAAGEYARLSVTDDGSGMTANVMRRMFEPFFTTKPVGEGTGLGLSVLHGVVKSMRGGVVVKSHQGTGTTFIILLPLAPETGATAKPAETIDAKTVSAGKILVVEDDESMRTVVRGTLESAGYTVTTAQDGQQALEMIRAMPRAWDLVFTDLTMPRLTGDLLASAIGQIRADLPVIICTGRGDKAAALTEFAKARILTKPIHGERLLDSVSAALQDAAAQRIASPS